MYVLTSVSIQEDNKLQKTLVLLVELIKGIRTKLEFFIFSTAHACMIFEPNFLYYLTNNIFLFYYKKTNTDFKNIFNEIIRLIDSETLCVGIHIVSIHVGCIQYSHWRKMLENSVVGLLTETC